MNYLRLPLLLSLLLAACASGALEHAGDPPPQNYRSVVAASFLERFPGQYQMKTLSISQPQPGARDVVSGWRVCVRAVLLGAGNPAIGIAYFFVDRHIENISVDDPACSPLVYEEWPEIDHSEGWRR